MRCVGHAARMGGNRNTDRILLGKLKEGILLGERGVNGRIILNWILKT